MRASSLTRCLVVAVMLFSWLVLTNHCALAAILSSAAVKSVHAHCHAAVQQDGKQSPGQGVRECCQAVKANLASKAVVKFDTSAAELQIYDILALLAQCADEPTAELLQDHGPPGARSFAEMVLQRSLLSHAPPVFA